MEETYSLTPADHTALVRAVLEHPLHVIRYLDLAPGQRSTPLQVVDAALQVRAFDDHTKQLLRVAKAAQPEYERITSGTDDGSGSRAKITEALEGTSVADMIAGLDKLLSDDSFTGSKEAVEFAKNMLLDGQDTIYAPDFGPNEILDGPVGPQGAAQQPAAADPPAHMTGAESVAHTDADIAAMAGSGDIAGAVGGIASIGAAIHVIEDAFFS